MSINYLIFLLKNNCLEKLLLLSSHRFQSCRVEGTAQARQTTS